MIVLLTIVYLTPIIHSVAVSRLHGNAMGAHAFLHRPLCNAIRNTEEKRRNALKKDRRRSMMSRLPIRAAQRRLLVAVLLAVCLALALPGTSEAHAILLRSDPAKDAVLSVALDTVHMWFSEPLNPTFSTAAVVSHANRRVSQQDTVVSPTAPTE